jgi:3-deoxy-D-manno-octulosonic-acid transferase
MTRLLAASALDAGRFRELGFPPERIEVTGNIKLDVSIPLLDEAARTGLRRELGLPGGRLVLLGSSTWPGEEEALVDALRSARGKGTPCSLLLVPRHAERRDEVERLVSGSGFSYHLRSKGPAPGEVDIAVGDTTGELRRMTQLADLVFVGKSLPPHTEGQTPVEAATLGKPVIFGPGMANFRAIELDLLNRGAARRVADTLGLVAAAEALLADEAARKSMAEAAASWCSDNGGGAARTLEAIRREFALRNKAG